MGRFKVPVKAEHINEQAYLWTLKMVKRVKQ